MERYEAYKDSGVEWIGEIPSKWQVMPIRVLATYNDESLPESTDPEYRFNYIDISSVTEGSIDSHTEQVFSSAPSRARRVIRRRDVLVSTVRTYLKAIALVDEEHAGFIASTGFCVLRPKTGTNSRWFGYALSEESIVDEIVARSEGVSYPAINASELVKLELRYPPIEEQRAIADFLDAKTAEIDSLVADCEREVGLLREYRKSVISEAVTKGLDPDAPMKGSGIEWIGPIPSHWEIRRIKDICNMQTGHTPPTDNREYFDGATAWFTPADILNDVLHDSLRTVTEHAVTDGQVPQYSAGATLLVAIGASAGKVGYSIGVSSSNQQITALMPIGVISKWLFYAMMANQTNLFNLAMYTTLPILNNDYLGSFPLVVPTLNEQQEIVVYLDAKTAEIDSLIENKQAMADKLREYRRSLISEAVTGKFKVPGID